MAVVGSRGGLSDDVLIGSCLNRSRDEQRGTTGLLRFLVDLLLGVFQTPFGWEEWQATGDGLSIGAGLGKSTRLRALVGHKSVYRAENDERQV